MSEQIRQHYLKQMGVTLWYSRCELPGAAVSPEFDFGDNVDCGSAAGNDSVAIEKNEGRVVAPKSAADILNSLSSAKAVSSQPAASSELPPESSPAQSSDLLRASSVTQDLVPASALPENEKLSLTAQSAAVSSSERSSRLELLKESPLLSVDTLELVLWVGKKNWFLSDNDPEFPDLLKQQLLLNIASALGEDTESEDVTCFRWPFFGNQRLPGNDAGSMFKILLEWLGEQVKSDDLNGFFMGEKVSTLFLQSALSDVVGKAQELNVSDERGVKVTPTFSLNDLLRDPSNKRVAWQHLRSCRIR